MGRHRRTIEREIVRGTIRLMNSDLTYSVTYCADVGNENMNRRHQIREQG
jgi:IS30 family transposase